MEREYLADLDSARYAAHKRFFLDEVVRWAEARYGVSAEPADRVVFGVSNGASSAVAMVRRSILPLRSCSRMSTTGWTPLGPQPPAPSGRSSPRVARRPLWGRSINTGSREVVEFERVLRSMPVRVRGKDPDRALPLEQPSRCCRGDRVGCSGAKVSVYGRASVLRLPGLQSGRGQGFLFP